ncbi:phage regulatory protein/antirepressor Ant [Ectobacillus antri]|uniref:phage regulatory protein/antirepressor Ant n=1 Tax=Ectobacillus antri TaxID=2486280 RepID=UPI000F5992A3|nr:phage regulatory protein/antirepressor Ant [Ectobacillus antri]
MKELVFVDKGEVVTDSLTVAEVFEKEHAKVIRAIEDLGCSTDFRKANFGVSEYRVAGNNKTYKKYLIKRDGLVFLVMGFTGEKAARFKEMYIEAFNHMEERLRQLSTPSYMLEDPIKRAERWIEEQKEKLSLKAKTLMLEQQVKENEEKVTYYDTILQSNSTVNITQIAKDYGLGGPTLNKILEEEKVQYKLNGQWLLYSKHQDKGYTKSKTHIDSTGEPRMHTKWTQKGRLFIHQVLGKRNIIPLMDREEESA